MMKLFLVSFVLLLAAMNSALSQFPWANVYEAESVEAAMAVEEVPEGYASIRWAQVSSLSEEERDRLYCSAGGFQSSGCTVYAKHTAGDWTFLIIRLSGAYEMTGQIAILNADGRVIDAFEYERSQENRYGATETETIVLAEGEEFDFLTTANSKTYDENGDVVERSTEMISYTFYPDRAELEKVKIE